MQDGRFSELYEQTVAGERDTKELLVHFEQDYPRITKEDNVDEIAKNLQRVSDRASVLAKLREKQAEIDRRESERKPKTQNDPER